ncbi:MAG: hypothetical protein NTX52_02300 [Planctomycetota bacterium]|nr:hypothetical protein [Planctomycetota bacterium]
MKLFEIKTTEYSGQQKYSNRHLVAAKDINHARKLARQYFKKCYRNKQNCCINLNYPDRFHYMDNCVILEINSIAETTFEKWEDRQVRLYSINELPKALVSCKKCGRLLEACEHILHCLDVGGEQSRQFADEIAYLKNIIKEARR